MRKVIRNSLFMLAAALWLPACSQAMPEVYVEGTHYLPTAQRLPTSDEGKIEVAEMFSYACPHCFHLEPGMDKWLETKSDDVNFVRIPAIFRDSWLTLAEVFYAAEALDVQEKLHPLMFEAIHVDKRSFTKQAHYLGFVTEHDIDRDEFKKAMESFSVQAQVKKALVLSKTSGITGVPAIIVNGKYIVSATSAGSEEEMFKVIDFLVAKEAEKLNAE